MANKEREAEIEDILKTYKTAEPVQLFLELFQLRRDRHRDKLEDGESAEARGKSQECKALIQLFD
jgi:hypothetical protein